MINCISKLKSGVIRSKLQSLSVFLPDLRSYQIESIMNVDNLARAIDKQPLSQDWQSLLCCAVDYPYNDFPSTQLRMAQFKLKPSVQTVCCCDPVMLQLTHRGAYMLGQNGVEFSQSDAIQVVAQINEKLLGEGEWLYLLDSRAWLFTSEARLVLDNTSKISDLIGKDMFDFSYQGKDASKWQQLANEIQMLLKQMQDYKELPSLSPEALLNVQFFDCVNINQSNSEQTSQLPFINKPELTLISDNELMKTFCMHTLLQHVAVEQLNQVRTEQKLIVAFDSEREHYANILAFFEQAISDKKIKEIQLVCQDAQFIISKPVGWFKRTLYQWLASNKINKELKKKP